MFKSLRYRLLAWFVLTTVIFSVLSFSLYLLHKNIKLKSQFTLERLENLRYEFLKDQYSVSGFISSELNNPSFYMTGESTYLNKHYDFITKIDDYYIKHFSNKSGLYSGINESLFEARNLYTDYCLTFDSLVYAVYNRGYQNFGLEGTLNSVFYKLENYKNINQNKLSRIKLAEKEYMHRSDTVFVSDIEYLCNSLITNILLSKRYNIEQKKELVELIKTYKKTFNNIVSLDDKIGFNNDAGLMHDLEHNGIQLENIVNSAINRASQDYEQRISRLNLTFILISFLIIIMSLILSVLTSRLFVENIEQLTKYISTLTKSRFNKKIEINLRDSTSEIKQIYIEFRNMLAQLKIREKQRDQALLSSEENLQRYRELADLLPQSIYETDRMGNLTYVNQNWFCVFGYTQEDIVNGINLIEIINSNSKKRLFGYSKVENNDFVATRKDGTRFPATVYSDFIKRDGEIIGRRGVIVDSTLRNKYVESLKKEKQRAVTSDKHKSSFLANLSHEIRTPMNSIIGFSSMLSSKQIPDKQKNEFIGHIQTSSEMLLNLIDDIIDIAKIEAGQLKINKSKCLPVEIVNNLCDNFEVYKKQICKKQIQISTSLPEKELPIITDEIRLKQILTNLISNAIKFTEKGKVTVGLRKKSEQLLEFYVEDTGIGMEKSDLRDIFDRFTRSKLSEEKKISGTGLGLTISKTLVKLLGGEMIVNSTPGKGSRFSFEIPYIRAKTKNIKTEEVFEALQYEWPDKTFLLVEDDDSSYKYLRYLLNKTKVNVIRAINGKEAIEVFKFHTNIDLVLLDLHMPVMDGFETIKRLKKQMPYMPVIAQTALAMEGDRLKCLSAGFDDYITKPLNGENLLAKIGQFVATNINPPENTNPPETNTEKKTAHILKKNNKEEENTFL